MIQTIGRAARNSGGMVIMYADSISPSMDYAIKETMRRREIQEKYNKDHNIIPQTIKKDIQESVSIKHKLNDEATRPKKNKKMTKLEREKLIEDLESEMKNYAKELNFEMAAQVRDAIMELKKGD